MFSPKRYSSEDKEALVHQCIDGVISPDADEAEIRWWCSVIPETLRYILRKQKVIEHQLADIDAALERIDAKCRLAYIHSDRYQHMSITERKDFSEAMKKGMNSTYAELVKRQAVLNELWSGYEADKINVQEKSFMIRKIANFEADRVQYEE